jgi:GTP 3',8-cyclase
MQSVNAHEAEALIDFALERRITLRFIELMPTGVNHQFASQEIVRGSQLIPYLQSRGLAPVGSKTPETSGPERLWTSPGHAGRIGLINPLSDNFCGACNRLRVTAQGKLRLCLFGKGELDLDMTSAQTVADSVRQAITAKPETHHLQQSNWGNVETFRTIGG